MNKRMTEIFEELSAMGMVGMLLVVKTNDSDEQQVVVGGDKEALVSASVNMINKLHCNVFVTTRYANTSMAARCLSRLTSITTGRALQNWTTCWMRCQHDTNEQTPRYQTHLQALWQTICIKPPGANVLHKEMRSTVSCCPQTRR